MHLHSWLEGSGQFSQNLLISLLKCSLKSYIWRGKTIFTYDSSFIEKIKFLEKPIEKKKLPLFTVLLVTLNANNIFCHYLPHLANISNQNLASKDSKSIVHHFWTLLDGLETKFFFSKTPPLVKVAISAEMEIRNGSIYLS